MPMLQARAKKDAKQLSAAALLENLLDKVPFQDLLYKADKQQQQHKEQQARPQFPLLLANGPSMAAGVP